MEDKYCCPNCFENEHIKQYIFENYDDEGHCSYCDTEDTYLISVKTLGIHLRECIEKAYEPCDAGTGAMYDSEEKKYLGKIYSIRELMKETECIFSYESENTAILDDLFENQYSVRDRQKGAEDLFTDIDTPNWAVKFDLYGIEQTGVFQNWEIFKHVIKHYGRFFDFDGHSFREDYLEHLGLYIKEFETVIPRETKFYRARETTGEWPSSIDCIDPYGEMGPPPAEKAKTNRMSPAGIPYLYLASDIETTVAECRIKTGKEAIIAEFVLKEDLRILDFSSDKYFPCGSIFDPEYEHENTWMNEFWESYTKEISQPVSDELEDHSYEYTATQLVAEYYRTKGYDGICFRSSVGPGKNYVLFMGPNLKSTSNAYPYPYGDIHLTKFLPILREYTEALYINKICKYEVLCHPHLKEERIVYFSNND